MDWTSFLMLLWRRTGGCVPFCEMAKSIWDPATVRYPEPETAVQERLL
jgi:hypothetical protein